MLAINLNLTGLKILVLGAGKVGLRKINKLINAGATDITVVEKKPSDDLIELNKHFKIYNNFEIELLKNINLIFLAVNDLDFANKIIKLANERNILINSAVCPEKGNIFLPVSYEEDNFMLTVSSFGASPALAKTILTDIKNNYFEKYKMLFLLLKNLRPLIINSGFLLEERKGIFYEIINSEKLLLSLQEKNYKLALECLNKILNNKIKITEAIFYKNI